MRPTTGPATGRVHAFLTAAGALLAGVALLLLALLPSAPSAAADMTAWVDNGKPLLSWSDELLFFASTGLPGRVVGIAAAAVFVVGSFPWLTPTWWNALVAVLLAGWGVF